MMNTPTKRRLCFFERKPRRVRALRWNVAPHRVLAVCAVLLTTATPRVFAAQQDNAEADKQPIVTTDLLNIRSVSSIDVSRDGERAVAVVRSFASSDGDSGSRQHASRSHLFLFDLRDDNAEPRQLTFGVKNDSSPVFSPDGKWIAFVRAADRDELAPENVGAQIWLLPVAGGEARQITQLENGAFSPRWSQDGRSLLVSTSVPMSEIGDGVPPWTMERPQRTWNDAGGGDDANEDGDANTVRPNPAGTRAEIRAWLAQNAEQSNPSVITRLNFQGEQSLRGADRFSQLAIVSLADIDAPTTTVITDAFCNHGGAAFLDQDTLVFSRRPVGDVHPDRVMESEIWRVETDGSDAAKLAALDGYSLFSPQPSRDGTAIAVRGRDINDPLFAQSHIGVITIDNIADPGGVQIDWLTDQQRFDGSIRSFQWMPRNLSLVFTTSSRGGVPLYAIGPAMTEPQLLKATQDGMTIGVQTFDVGGGAIVYSQTAPTNPCVLRVRDARGDRLLADLNEWVANRELSMPQEGVVSRPDGTSVQYWLMPPTKFDSTKQYPLALEIHGGPSAMWGPGEASMWHEFQLLCSWGYAVAYCNPRGSGGYGYDFQKANYQNWGDGPAGDVLSVVDRVARQPWIDDDRMVVTGGSYAGYLTAWIVSQDHRFKAAVAQRGVYDLATFFGEGNAWRLIPGAMGGYPWEAPIRQVLRRESPFTHVDRIRTPLLIMHASRDLRTGVSQSEMLYRALKVLEKPVEYIRYPDAGHDLSRSGEANQRMDRLNRIIEFFERHIRNTRAAPTHHNE